MLQVKIMLARKAAWDINEGMISDLVNRIMPFVEKAFEIEGRSDATCTVSQALYTYGEADVQFEVAYTAGNGEHSQDKPFNPTTQQQDLLADIIHREWVCFAENYELLGYKTSVWCRPQYNSVFKVWPSS